MKKEQIIEKLFDIGAVKFGNFTLKSGIVSPIYIDLRLIISYPALLEEISNALWEKAKDLNFDLICGVPYTALPIATAISLKQHIPMIMRRKEEKKYGTKRRIEGKYETGQICLIIEDLITSGLSVNETIDPIKEEGMQVTDILIVIDREQGGRAHLENKGYHIFSLFTLSEMLDHLQAMDKIDLATTESVKAFIQSNQVQPA